MSSTSSLPPLRIVIPGGTGHLGQILARHFYEQGHQVVAIARRSRPAEWPVVTWNGSDLGRWTDVLEGADVVINLAGRTVNCRYTAANQRDIRNSRTITTGLIGEAIARTARPPRLWLNASTATIYRHSLDAPMDDVTGQVGGTEPGAPASWRFSVEVAKAWEDAFFAQALPRTRRVALRTAMVMSPEPGGAFDMFLRLVRWGLGGSIASGWQYVSWIHDVDLIRALEFLIAHDEINGPVNISSPEPVSNRRFMRCLRSAWCTSYVAIPTPGWVLPLGAMLLRTETELVLKSRRVEPRRLLAAGFDFHFPNWRGACHNLVSRWRQLQPE